MTRNKYPYYQDNVFRCMTNKDTLSYGTPWTSNILNLGFNYPIAYSNFFGLVLHNVMYAKDADVSDNDECLEHGNDECCKMVHQAWYMDDGFLVGMRSAVFHALSFIKEVVSSLGVFFV